MNDNIYIGATVEARMNSTRLPGKVMTPILGIPMLAHLLSRIKRSKKLQGITVATTNNASDDVIEQLAHRMNVNVYRGSEQDVLGRITAAAEVLGYNVIVKLTGDNPLYSADLIDAMIEYFLNNDCDLVTNTSMDYTDRWNEKRTFPLGLGVQILRIDTLKDAEKKYHDSSSREHPTLSILKRPDIYKLGAFHAKGSFIKLNKPHYRLTVDTLEDLNLISRIFEELYPDDTYFSLFSVVELLDKRPDLVKINSHVKQKKPLKL